MQKKKKIKSVASLGQEHGQENPTSVLGIKRNEKKKL